MAEKFIGMNPKLGNPTSKNHDFCHVQKGGSMTLNEMHKKTA
jgi:hypothetical protein